jgi:phenylpropionate dioxygenase-like ring-hydroxylating dioxygenase large terminal subunit
MTALLSDHEITERVLAHIERRTTDVGCEVWREPVANYRSPARLQAEIERVLLRIPAVFCPSTALAEPGSFVARDVCGRPVVAVRGEDGVVRAFKNVCRHRGMRVARDSGCTRVFICGYHGWTYGLDGHLRHVPHEHGFPGLDRAQHGLAPLTAIEKQGMVFIAQQPASAALLEDLPDNIDLSGAPCSVSASETEANWKIVLEGFLEGYHIRATHPQSFLPYGFDNLNVVECSGRHSRVTFPFQRIRKLAQVPPEQRCLTGFVTSVYHIFPNALITVLSNHTNLIVLEPVNVERTNVVRYTFENTSAAARTPEAVQRDTDFVATGAAEDREVVCAIQRGLASGANDSFVFGHFESAIVHFHRTLDAELARGTAQRTDLR